MKFLNSLLSFLYRAFPDRLAALIKYNSIDSDQLKGNSNEDQSDDSNSVIDPNTDDKQQQCSPLKETAVDITTHDEFRKFDFQPNWMKNKEYWDATFEERYDKLLKNEQRSPLRVWKLNIRCG